MPRIDGILNIVVQQRATELRLGTGKVPKLSRLGEPVRFLMPETSETTLRDLLGELFDEEREAELLETDKIVTTYKTPKLGHFELAFTTRRARLPTDEPKGPATGDLEGFDVRFRRAPDDDVEEELPPLPPKNPQEPAGDPRRPAGDPGRPAGDPGRPAGDSYPAPQIQHQPAQAAPQLVPAPGFAPGFAPAATLPASEHPQASAQLCHLLQRGVDARASDIHIAAGEPPALRVDGRIRILGDEGTCDMDALLGGMLVPRVVASMATGRSGDLSLAVAGLGRFRVNLYRASGGMSAAIRILPRSAPRLTELNLPVDLSDLLELPHGLVILCGPTGSGKSSTMAALAQEALVQDPCVLVTLEDPIEYKIRAIGGKSLVRQRQIGVHVSSFTDGLRDALREDPDVILVGEMRDTETITMALTAAETGHLVLASLHSRSSVSAIERIVDSYPEQRQHQVRVQLADALRVVIAQRLLPRASGKGRVPALEVLRVNHSVAAMIRDTKTPQIISAIQSSRAEGMLPLERSLAELVGRGVIDYETARRAANDVKSLGMYLNR